MTTNYVLVDYENVNADNLNLLAGGSHTFEVLIFLGPLQTKIPVDLSSRGSSRPRKMKTLIGTIGSVFKGALDEATIRSLIEALRKMGHVVVDGDKVTYNLPARETE